MSRSGRRFVERDGRELLLRLLWKFREEGRRLERRLGLLRLLIVVVVPVVKELRKD